MAASVVGKLEKGHRQRRAGFKEMDHTGMFHVSGQEDAVLSVSGVKNERTVIMGFFTETRVENGEGCFLGAVENAPAFRKPNRGNSLLIDNPF